MQIDVSTERQQFNWQDGVFSLHGTFVEGTLVNVSVLFENTGTRWHIANIPTTHVAEVLTCMMGDGIASHSHITVDGVWHNTYDDGSQRVVISSRWVLGEHS